MIKKDCFKIFYEIHKFKYELNTFEYLNLIEINVQFKDLNFDYNATFQD